MRTPGRIVLRLSVVAGAVSLLAGLAGLIMLALAPAPPPAPRGEGAPASVHLRGVEGGAALPALEVRWREGDDEITQEARRGEAPGVWILPPLPEGRQVTLRVRRDTDGKLLHEVVYEGGVTGTVELDLDAPASGD